MTDIMTEYRHNKIADILAIIWACNDSDSVERRPAWTSPKMATSVVCPLFQAVRGLLDADYDDWLATSTVSMMRSEFKDKVIEQIVDGSVQEGYNVTSIINFVLGDA